MRKLILLFMLSFGALSMQAQSSLKKQVEEGIEENIRLTQEREWREAFATCRALDSAIGKGNPDLHYLVAKERFRMYSRINKPNDARSQMEKMEDYARQSGKSDVIEDMLIAKGAYSAKMSTPYSTAVALIYGKAGLQEFGEDVLENDTVKVLTKKVEVVADEEGREDEGAECHRPLEPFCHEMGHQLVEA